MGDYFNNSHLTIDNVLTSLYAGYLKDYPKPIPTDDDKEDYEVSCYVEEYVENGETFTRFRERKTNKIISFWMSPFDQIIDEQKREMQELFSDIKRMNKEEIYKKDGNVWVVISAIFLDETEDTIEVASYFSEVFFSTSDPLSF